MGFDGTSKFPTYSRLLHGFEWGEKRYSFDRSNFSKTPLSFSTLLSNALINVLSRRECSPSPTSRSEDSLFARIDPPNSRLLSPPESRPFSRTISEWKVEQVVRQTIPSCSCNANVHSARELLNDLEFSSSTLTLTPPRSPPHLRVSRTFCRRCLELASESLPSLISRTRGLLLGEPRSNLLFPLPSN